MQAQQTEGQNDLPHQLDASVGSRGTGVAATAYQTHISGDRVPNTSVSKRLCSASRKASRRGGDTRSARTDAGIGATEKCLQSAIAEGW